MQVAPLALSLSGGGSRAAAFHRGTLAGLAEVGLLPDVDVVSTVSGGSLFGAAWVRSVAKGQELAQFLAKMERELREGFVARSLLSWRALGLPFPGQSRTELFARAFDEIFFQGMTLGELPERPALCLNTTVLNTGQTGRLTRDGFETRARRPPGKEDVALPVEPMPQFPVARAVAASAAFPVGLAPVELRRGRELSEEWGRGTDLEGLRALQLTDGGVLENLGVQTILTSPTLGRWDFVVSDAGTRPELWKPTFAEGATSAFMGTLSAGTLKAVANLMSDKCDRHMRRETFAALEASWLAAAAGSERSGGEAMRSFLGEAFGGPGAPSPLRRRRILMARVDQSWDDLLLAIPPWRLVELGSDQGGARAWLRAGDVGKIEAFLAKCEGPRKGDAPAAAGSGAPAVASGASTAEGMARAKGIFSDQGGLDGRRGVERANDVATNFTALDARDVATLAEHARWQIHALRAIYW